MKEHIHVPSVHDDHVHAPRWDEPSRGAMPEHREQIL